LAGIPDLITQVARRAVDRGERGRPDMRSPHPLRYNTF